METFRGVLQLCHLLVRAQERCSLPPLSIPFKIKARCLGLEFKPQHNFAPGFVSHHTPSGTLCSSPLFFARLFPLSDMLFPALYTLTNLSESTSDPHLFWESFPDPSSQREDRLPRPCTLCTSFIYLSIFGTQAWIRAICVSFIYIFL